jgi:hypothetical protein
MYTYYCTISSSEYVHTIPRRSTEVFFFLFLWEMNAPIKANKINSATGRPRGNSINNDLNLSAPKNKQEKRYYYSLFSVC